MSAVQEVLDLLCEKACKDLRAEAIAMVVFKKDERGKNCIELVCYLDDASKLTPRELSDGLFQTANNVLVGKAVFTPDKVPS
jgi:hypothetical protein